MGYTASYIIEMIPSWVRNVVYIQRLISNKYDNHGFKHPLLM